MAQAKAKHYLTNRELIQEIRISKKQDKLTSRAENMFMLLGNRIIKKMYYVNYMDKDDCYQTGILGMLLNWRSFNEEKSDNAFAYYTEIFKRSMAKGWKELHALKGDPDGDVKVVSIHFRGSDGEERDMYNL